MMPTARSRFFDVAVIGGGLAGLSAATRAAELGLRVVLLEKGDEDAYLCNTRLTGGFFHVCREDMLSAPPLLNDRINAVTEGCAAPDLRDALTEDSSRTLAWLKAHGVRFIKAGPGQMQNVLAPPSVRLPGMHWHGRAGDVLVRTLEARFREYGGTFLRGHRATELEMEAGVCRGVRGVNKGYGFAYSCDAVVIADGGFQGNPSLVEMHISPAPQQLMQRHAGSSVGDGLLMAQRAGARLVGLDRFYGHLLYHGAMQDARFWPFPTLDFLASAAIVVDGNGRRFADEAHGGTHMANAIAALDDPLSNHIVFDSAIWNGPGSEFLLPPNPHLVRAGAEIVEASTIADLARAIGVLATALETTVESHNRFVAGGPSPQPARSTRIKAWPIQHGPFFAVKICAGITYTMGGVATDAWGRALAGDGTGVIPGLFAVGSASGGLEGGSHAGYVGGLSKAAVFGMRAAESIARGINGTLERHAKRRLPSEANV